MQSQIITFSATELYKAAYRRFKEVLNEQLDDFIDYHERQPVYLLILKILIPSLYIIAVANDIDKWRSAVLVLMAFLYGMFKVGMLSLKFFKELLDVLIAYKEKKVKIEGIQYIYIIIFLSVVLICLIVTLIFIIYKNDTTN